MSVRVVADFDAELLVKTRLQFRVSLAECLCNVAESHDEPTHLQLGHLLLGDGFAQPPSTEECDCGRRESARVGDLSQWALAQPAVAPFML